MPPLQHVVLLDKIDLSARDILVQNSIKVDVYEKFTDIPAGSLSTIDGLVVRSATKVTADIMKQCSNLKIIGRAGTGVDNIDVPTATARGIVVMNTPGGNTISAAEHTCFMIIAMARNAANNNAIMKSHKWSKGAGQELMGKTLGIVGLGRIGTEVATRMQSFGMKTVGFDPIVSAESVAPLNIQWLTLEQMWPVCDYITLHTPLIPQTKDLVSSKTLALCKKGVKIINVARGGIVNEVDLLENLNSGQCGGAGLDVFVDEPPKEWTLIDHPNVVATAHLGASTKEGQLKCGQEIASQFVDFSTNATSLVGVINSQALVASFSEDTAPWLSLGTRLGQLLSVVNKTQLKGDYKVEVSGTGYPKNLSRFIIPAVAAGVLKKEDPSANLINGSALAEKNSVTITFSVAEVQGDVPCELKVSAFGNSVTGSVVNSVPVLNAVNTCVFLDPFTLDVTKGVLFLGVVTQTNLPAVLGSLQKAGLKRVNFASSDSTLCIVGTATSEASDVVGNGISFATVSN